MALLLASGACGSIAGTTGDNKFPGEGTGDSSKWFTSTATDRTSLTLAPGTSGTFHITTTRGNGYTGTVYYSFSMLGNISATIMNSATMGTTTTSDLVITIPPAYPAPVLDFHFLLNIMGTTADVVNPGHVDLVLNITKAP